MVSINQIYIIFGAFLIVFVMVIFVWIYNANKKKDPKSKKELLEQQLKDLEDAQKADEIKIKEAKVIANKIVKDKKKTKVEVKEVKTVPKVAADKLPQYQDDKGFDVLTERKSKFKLKYWKDWYLNKTHPESIALINMELMNGFHKIFLVKEFEEGFKYKNKKYLFDNEAKYFIIDSKIWAYDFHETFTLPIKRKIPITNIRKTLESSNISEVEYATNPATLERFAISKIAEGIMRGAEMEQVFKFLKLMAILILVISFIHMMLFMMKTGMFSSIKIPGIVG